MEILKEGLDERVEERINKDSTIAKKMRDIIFLLFFFDILKYEGALPSSDSITIWVKRVSWLIER